ncbi:MAG TPA: haloacid dehalogenase-like hydrolase [Gemmatimonadaceae bacterium]|nr:haloacid dehalogenase-like hydrolase [Gemmatimonadaceae bacterium]
MLDVDSTLCAIEGIDWLASRRSSAVRDRVAEVTERAMRGEIPLGDVYAERLEAVRPSREEVRQLADAYMERIEPRVAESLAKLTNAGIHVVLVTAGIRDAIVPVAEAVGLLPSVVHAVSLYFTEPGDYLGFDAQSPLTRNGGKVEMVRALGLARPILGVGDGITDLEARTADPPAVDAFAAYTGVATRDAVVRGADYVISRFDELPGIVFG